MYSFSWVNKGNLHGCIKFCRRCIYVIANVMNNSVCTLQKCLQQNFGRINRTNCVRNSSMVLFRVFKWKKNLLILSVLLLFILYHVEQWLISQQILLWCSFPKVQISTGFKRRASALVCKLLCPVNCNIKSLWSCLSDNVSCRPYRKPLIVVSVNMLQCKWTAKLYLVQMCKCKT